MGTKRMEAVVLGILACALSPAAGAERALTLVENGAARGSIVVADEPDRTPIVKPKDEDAALYPALFLQRHIQKATGALLPILKESENPRPPYILVGRTKLGERAGVSGAKLPAEGYLVKAFGDGVAIVGEVADGIDRGVLNGVYRFLEETLGIRWYFGPEDLGTVVPASSSLRVPAGLSLSGRPFFPFRVGGISHWNAAVAREWHPALRFGSSRGMGANHTQENWHAIYGKTHPEYFALKEDGTRAITAARAGSGQSRSYLCFSEPGVLRQHIENVDEYFKTGNAGPWVGGAMPRGNNIPFGPNDVPWYCSCPACSARIDKGRGKHGSASNLIFGFLNAYATEVKKRHPEAVIWSLAYNAYKLPPTDIKRFPDNVGITLCLIPTVVVQNQAGVREKNRALIEQWFELVNRNPERLIIWDYYCYPNWWFVAPTEIPHVLKDHVGFLKTRALGIFNNGFNPSTRGDMPNLYLTYRIVWLMHRLLWDPDLDLDRARREWAHDLFGPAGGEMDAFYRLLEERWEKVVWKDEPVGSNVSEAAVYLESYPAESVRELRALYQKALAKAPEGGIHRRRLEWFHEKAFNRFFARADDFHRAAGAIPSYAVRSLEGVRVNAAAAFEDIWANVPSSLATAERVTGEEIADTTAVRVGYDRRNLYVAARMATRPEDGEPVARAAGRENPAVEQDDKLILHIRPPKADGYIELIVNPGGAFSSAYNILPSPTRGFFPSHPMLPWKTDGIAVSGKAADGAWCAAAVIPWASIPGTGGAPPAELRAQFIRWNAKEKYRYTVWSPVLSTWDYPVSRFGRLIFEGATPKDAAAETAAIAPAAAQVGYVSLAGTKPAQPSDAAKAGMGGEKGVFIVGQRDLGKTTWMELRGVLKFDIARLAGAEARIARAVLDTSRVNVVGEPPFDAAVVDGIAPGDGARVLPADYGAEVLHPSAAVIPAPGPAPKQRLLLDVTESLRKDVAAGRTTSAYRLRISGGCTRTDGKIRYLVFGGVRDGKADEVPVLRVTLVP